MRTTQLQALLVIAALGAALCLIQLLGTAGALVGAGLLVFTTVLAAPAAPDGSADGLNWWALIAAGAGLALLGVPVGLLSATLGGLLTGIGGGVAMVGVAFGYPT